MPFINLDIDSARQILEDQNLLDTLIRDGKINPLEFDFLVLLKEFSATEDSEKKEAKKKELNDLCSKYFPKEAPRAMKLLTNFVTKKRSNVSWVLFSRTIQFIPFVEKNPLDGYKSKLNDIFKTRIYENLSTKSGG
ncbi:MAG: hypothetical protein ACXAC7_17475 [Candidatus Hodarchaeales archaeon]